MEIIMDPPLQSLFQAIAQAQDESELRGAMKAKLGIYSTVNCGELMFLDQLATVHVSTASANPIPVRSPPLQPSIPLPVDR